VKGKNMINVKDLSQRLLSACGTLHR